MGLPRIERDWESDLRAAKAEGLTVKQAAEKLGVSRGTINKEEIATGIYLRRVRRNIQNFCHPMFDWENVLAEAQQKGMNANQLATQLGVTSAAIKRAIDRYGIELPKQFQRKSAAQERTT